MDESRELAMIYLDDLATGQHNLFEACRRLSRQLLETIRKSGLKVYFLLFFTIIIYFIVFYFALGGIELLGRVVVDEAEDLVRNAKYLKEQIRLLGKAKPYSMQYSVLLDINKWRNATHDCLLGIYKK